MVQVPTSRYQQTWLYCVASLYCRRSLSRQDNEMQHFL
jgi:hypothetical protein